jgi:hypothetical protein
MNFLKALLLFIRMYRDGFYFSENSHISGGGVRWGFYRFNHKYKAAMFDIDYSFDGIPHYFHVHGDDYRVDFSDEQNAVKITETPTKKMTDEDGCWWPRTEVISQK